MPDPHYDQQPTEVFHKGCVATPDAPCFHPSHRPGCQVIAPIVGTDVAVLCERERGHHSPHTGVYDHERYSWPHHQQCMTKVGAPDLRHICDCRTLAMVSAEPSSSTGQNDPADA